MVTGSLHWAAALFVVAVIEITAAISVSAEIKVRDCWSEVRQVTCLCMDDTETGGTRRMCPVEGEDCWDDSGWVTNVQPAGGYLHSYFDSMGNLYIAVGANRGGVFSGSMIGSRLSFTADHTDIIMLPAHLVQ
jgi:hypothetical protein